MTKNRQDKISEFFETRSTDGKTHVLARLAWVRFCANTAGDYPATAEDKSRFIRNLSGIMGEDNAVEFRLRFL
jgi:hypothetical protein